MDILDSSDEFRIAGTGWYLDARQPRARAIISHAHTDHLGRHRQALMTPETSSFLDLRASYLQEAAPADAGVDDPSVYPDERMLLPLGHTWRADDGAMAVTFYSAGHVLGSAMALVTTARGTLLYTGDFRLRGDSLTVPPAVLPAAGQVDTLLMECTFGLERYRFPPRAQTAAQLVDIVGASFAAGRQPVCLCYSLGKAQEVARILVTQGFGVAMHKSAWEITQACARHGMAIDGIREYVPTAKDTAADERAVVVLPPHIRRSRLARQIAHAEFIVVSGWALDASCIYWHQAQHAVPLSDHADFDELNELVDRVQPKEVLLTHGFVKQFCSHLRSRGIKARPAVEEAQGSLFDL